MIKKKGALFLVLPNWLEKRGKSASTIALLKNEALIFCVVFFMRGGSSTQIIG